MGSIDHRGHVPGRPRSVLVVDSAEPELAVRWASLSARRPPSRGLVVDPLSHMTLEVFADALARAIRKRGSQLTYEERRNVLEHLFGAIDALLHEQARPTLP